MHNYLKPNCLADIVGPSILACHYRWMWWWHVGPSGWQKKHTFDGTDIWKLDKVLKLKVLKRPDEMLAVLKELYDGFGHRGLAAVYHHFKLRYWVPAAAKAIKQYIEGYSACQRLAAPNRFEVPGYQVQPKDVFSHKSIDSIGPFPADPRSGDLHVIIAVEWLTRWVEAKAVNGIDAESVRISCTRTYAVLCLHFSSFFSFSSLFFSSSPYRLH